MASKSFSVKLPEEIVEVLKETAVALGTTPNSLARRAIEAVLDTGAVEDARARRLGAEIRSRLRDERALVESGAVHYSHLPKPAGYYAAVASTGLEDAPPLSETSSHALIMAEVRIGRLTRIIDNATCDAVRLAAIESRGKAREQKLKLLLSAARVE
jgi:predicted transcriptional regulator